MDVADRLSSIEAALANGEATLSTDVGGHREVTSVRLWQGQVLVDWEPDARAGGCLLRPVALRRLLTLQATVTDDNAGLTLNAPGRVVAALSPTHADLVQRLGGARRVALRVKLHFEGDQFVGGDETYFVRERGVEVTLLSLHARVTSPRTSLAAR